MPHLHAYLAVDEQSPSTQVFQPQLTQSLLGHLAKLASG